MKFIITYQFIDLYYYIYYDLRKEKNAFYVDAAPSLISKITRRLVFSNKIFPLKGILKRLLFRYTLKCWIKDIDIENETVCFILQPMWLYSGMDDYIRKHYPKAKFVSLFSDLVSVGNIRKKLLEEYRDRVDLIFSYDMRDAKKYGLIYQKLPYSDLSFLVKDINVHSDICFVGQDKGRLKKILNLAEFFHKNGFICDFHLINIPLWKRKNIQGVHYHNGFFSYAECLKISAGSKCILELTQDGSTGNTVRVPEAIFLGKKLLSDNTNLKNDSSFVPENMAIFTEPDDIDIDFLKREVKIYPDGLKEQYAPGKFLKKIEKLLGDEI